MSDRLSEDLKSLTNPREVNPETRGRALRWVIGLALVGAVAAAGWLYLSPYLTARLWKTEVVATEISMLSPSQGSTELSSTGYVVAPFGTSVATATRCTSIAS